jgi:hypothetical protein
MPTTILAAAHSDPARASGSVIQDGVAQIEAVPGEIAQLPLFQHLEQVMPVADLFFGAGMLMAIMLVHATGVRVVTNHVVRRSVVILARPARWRADAMMSGAVFMLLSLHLIEIVLWTAALVYSGLLSDWRTAGFFAGNTYTTVGYGEMVLPVGWKMLAPIIAISGLFTFGWSGSVLVDLVARCQKIKDAATGVRA